MKKLISLVLLLGLTVFVRAQTVTIDFNVGILTGANGTTPVSDGSLIQVIAAPLASGLVAPTPTSFVSGTEILLWSGAFDSTTSFPSVPANGGAMDIAPAAISSTTLPAGYALMVQWFPTLTTAATSPGNSTPYGQYSTINDASWVAPSPGSTTSYSFATLSYTAAAGTLANSVGAASQLTASAVPEPATYAAILGACALGFVAMRRRIIRA